LRLSVGATYTVHLIIILIGKLVVDLLFVLIELFSLGVMAQAHTSEYSLEIDVFCKGLVSFGQMFT